MRWLLNAQKLLLWSLKLDYTFIVHVPDISFLGKINFLLKKYWMFLKNVVCADNVTCVKVFGLDYFCNERYGLASLQRVYCSSYGIKKFIPANPTVIDVGANIGQFTFFCRHYLHAKRILSIEPIIFCYDVLRKNSSDPVDCLNCLVSCDTGNREFFICKKSPQLSSCIKNEWEEYDDGALSPSRRLDDLVRVNRVEKIDLLKIDTEGTEYDVVQSAEGILDRVGAMMVELSLFRNSDGNLFATGKFLEDHDFQLAAIDYGNGIRSTDVDAVFVKK